MRLSKKLFFGIIVFLIFILVLITFDKTGLLIIDSPEDTNYEEGSIDLNVSDPDVFYWEYSLDDGENLSFTPNITLINLSYGEHNVKVYGLKEGWNKTFGGDSEDTPYSIQQTSDGGYVVAGEVKSLGDTNGDMWIIKTDSDGSEEWNKTFGEDGVSNEARSIQQTSDGGYIVAGRIGNNFWIIKLYSNGSEEWNKTFGGTSLEIAYSIQQTTDGGYVVAGTVRSLGDTNGDMWIIKTDSDGSEEWNKTFGGAEQNRAYSIQQTSDGGYVVAGYEDSGGGNDFWVIKTDLNGSEEWNKTFGGPNSEVAFSIQQTTDGGYVVVGYTEIFLGGEGLVIKIDSDGNEEWNKTFGGGNYLSYHIQQTSDGGYVFVNIGIWDFLITKLNSTGGHIWNKTFGGAGQDIAHSIQQTSDGGYIVAGFKDSGGGKFDFWIIKLDKERDSVDFSVGEEVVEEEPVEESPKQTAYLSGGVQSISTAEINGETPASFKLSEVNKNVIEMSFDLNEDVPNLKISVTTREFNPTFSEHKGTAQSYLKISRSGVFDSQINSVKIKFVVPVDWMKEKDISRDSVKLLRHSEGKWNDLKTEFVSRDNEHYYFNGETPGFSYFAITGEEDSGFVEEIIVEKPLIEKPAKERKYFFEEIKQILRDFVSYKYFIVAITIICIGLISGIVFYFVWRKFNLGNKRKKK